MPRRFRLTIRRMILVATLLAVLLVGEKLRRISRYRSFRAAELMAEADSFARDAASFEKLLAGPGGSDEADRQVRLTEIREAIDGSRRRSEFYRNLADVYDFAASRPWVRMDPEPSPVD